MIQELDLDGLSFEFKDFSDAPFAGQVFDLPDRKIPLLKTFDHLVADGTGGAGNGNIPQFFCHFSASLLSQRPHCFPGR